jgi:hypothetical protein
LTRLAWWDWSHAALRAALPDFRGLPVEEFLAKYEPETVWTSGLLAETKAAS